MPARLSFMQRRKLSVLLLSSPTNKLLLKWKISRQYPRQPTRNTPKYLFRKVRKRLEKLNVNKASGPDGIPSQVLKDLRAAASELSNPVARLLRLQQTYMKEQWKDLNTRGLGKKASRVVNYLSTSDHKFDIYALFRNMVHIIW